MTFQKNEMYYDSEGNPVRVKKHDVGYVEYRFEDGTYEIVHTNGRHLDAVPQGDLG